VWEVIFLSKTSLGSESSVQERRLTDVEEIAHSYIPVHPPQEMDHGRHDNFERGQCITFSIWRDVWGADTRDCREAMLPALPSDI
jgi:hypothetical protein